MNKKFIFFAIGLLLFLFVNTQAQTINSDFCGQNAWLPSTFTDFNDAVHPNNPQDYYLPTCTYCTTTPPHQKAGTAYGDLDNQWNNVQTSGARMVRVGGSDYNEFKHENWDYRWQVEKIKGKGMIPVVQVGVGTPNPPPNGTEGNFPSNGSDAADLVTYLNITNAATAYCKYWMIGNEYDLIGYTPAQCFAKIKTFSQAMKAIDPNIIIIGPELASYSPSNTTYVSALTTAPNNILPYIDIFSFHMYPSATIDPASCSTSVCVGDRNQYITYAQNSLVPKLTSLKTFIGSKPIAITEFNATNCDGLCPNWNAAPILGLDSRSFIAGQLIAEQFATGMDDGQVQFMNMWSVIEGNPDRGYIQNSSGMPRSSYWHYQMVANNFSGTYYSNSNTYTNYKAFAYKNASEIGVLVMNQDQQNSPRGTDNTTKTFTINFDNAPGSSGMDFAFAMGLSEATTYTCNILRETTMLLKFNLSGIFQSSQVYSLQDALRMTDIGPEPFSSCISITAVNEITESSNISIFPNPNNGAFTIQSTSEGVYSIVNELGKTVQTFKLNRANNYSTNIENLNSGIYFLVGINTHKKIIVTK